MCNQAIMRSQQAIEKQPWRLMSWKKEAKKHVEVEYHFNFFSPPTAAMPIYLQLKSTKGVEVSSKAKSTKAR
jgi:hypothetical protein